MAAPDPYHQTGDRPVQPGVPLAQPVAHGQPLPQAQPTQPSRVQPRPVAVTGGSMVTIRERDSDLEGEEDFSEATIRNAPPWLVSAAFHMTLLIILGLTVIAVQPRKQINLDVEAIYAEQLGEQLEFDSPLGKDPIDAIEEPVLTPDDLPEVDDPFAAPTMLEIQPDGTAATSDIDSRQIGLALNGREEGSKKSLLGRYGGTKTTEAAVLAGLQWLARNQVKTGRQSGSWSLSGPYRDGVPDDMDNPPAATAMALLAFQGAGITHKKGKFKQNVIRAWDWLLKEQDSDGNFFHEGAMNHRFYTQAMATIAICELYGMTKDEKYRKPAELAVGYCLNSQSSLGGWRYSPQADSDVSVTGWVVMALQSARMAGLDVPEDHFRRIERYLDKVQRSDGSRYPYQRGMEIRLAMTAEALLIRQYLGWPRDHPALIDGVEWITSPGNLVNYERGRDVYYWYYATQVAHHMEGEYWKRWNNVMRQVLPEQQVKHGRERGSWDPKRPTHDQWAPHGGRLYVTCLSIYMLEVYYRHLPIYTNVYNRLMKSGRNPR